MPAACSLDSPGHCRDARRSATSSGSILGRFRQRRIMRIRTAMFGVAGLLVAGLLTACSGSGGTSTATSTPTASTNAAPTIPFEKYTLPNGLEVILSED